MPSKGASLNRSENNNTKLVLILGFIVLVILVLFLLVNFNSNSVNNTSDYSDEGAFNYSGNVVDLDSSKLDSVKITGFNGETALTDKEGNYSFKSSYLGFGIITFEKEGFVPLHKQVIYGEDTTLNATMVKEVAFQKVDPTKQVFIEMENASLKAEANSFVIKGTNEKAITANVSLTPFDPSNEIEFETFPGDLSGIRIDESETYFESISFMKIQVEDDLNRPLDLASGKTAEIKFPIPSTLSQKAPTTIPLWYFSPTEGRWIERGEANKICEGNICNYYGKIDTIASWWNCDDPVGDSTICGSETNTCLKGTPKIDTDLANQDGGVGTYTWGCKYNNRTYKCIISADYCGQSVGQCISGEGTRIADTSTDFRWKCGNQICSSPKIITGECGTIRDSCVNGTFEDQADTDEKYNWLCKGSTANLNKSCSLNKPVNGACGSSTNECLNNTISNNSDENTTHFKWTCGGLYGGTNANCGVLKRVDGNCGTSNDSCLSGELAQVEDTDTLYKWRCNGRYGGTDKDCNKYIPINGECSTTLNTCIKGDPEDIPDSPTEQIWMCNGDYDGTDLMCTSDLLINGECPTVLTVNTLNDCKDGNFVDILDSPTKYLWSCAGLNNGSTANCEMDIVPADGVCGYRKDACKVGELTDLEDVEGQYNWRCDGLNGGKDTPCSFIISESKGSCGTVSNICSGGTFVDIPDSDTYYKWDCVNKEGYIAVGCYLRK